MIIEALTFKLALDFFIYLKKNRIIVSDVRIGFYDKLVGKTEFSTFTDLADIQSFYDSSYVPFDPCFLGDLAIIEKFRSESNTYNFTTSYIATDVTGNYSLVKGSSFDKERNSQRSVLTKRQISFINKSVEEYRKFFNELKRIYVTGIYSPCYAEPGWSQNTWYLNQLREAFTNKSNSAEFPYTSTNMTKNPPS